MNSTISPTPPKFPEDFRAHFLDRIDRNAAEVGSDDAKVGGLCETRRTSQISLRRGRAESLAWPRSFSDRVLNRCRCHFVLGSGMAMQPER
jgi:hypothetical protein